MVLIRLGFGMCSTSFMAGMMEQGMDRLGKSLILTEEEEEELILPLQACQGGTEVDGFPLVGRLLSPRYVWFDVFQMTLTILFRPIKGMTVKMLEEHRFLLWFHHCVDRDRALDGCPWTFDKNLIILSKVSVNENPLEVDLNWCSFYVFVHGLPLGLMTNEVAMVVGNRLGKFVELDHAQRRYAWGSKLRIRVALDVRKPLKCGVLGHIIRDCNWRIGEEPSEVEGALPYGAWLREPRAVGSTQWSAMRGKVGGDEQVRGVDCTRVFREVSGDIFNYAGGATTSSRPEERAAGRTLFDEGDHGGSWGMDYGKLEEWLWLSGYLNRVGRMFTRKVSPILTKLLNLINLIWASPICLGSLNQLTYNFSYLWKRISGPTQMGNARQEDRSSSSEQYLLREGQ
ncbi:UNVERIFIED_CONTAM: hypothetical protein Slati_1436300 [Sesamum latifolium]|uniref:DUF4283 domain-containing protein n=1 Tax=Sesamum latifolium TaxID=2727402 RepID=A0AAW2X6C8_9LAMI